ncbi:hypothetical protein [Aquibium oceanicum]|uniref:Uncharacterized protein n=1 Tax=Aquibium oceanicum TaxID=1670800 RepID=A0A1L3SXR3_9HYPH|nr:hypothetical protein [Aquibium oceanicum]APH74151.1 hypothetical protein BSQ44_24340 [Aquibium oceanicum]
MNQTNLRRLINHLRSIKPSQFAMGEWVVNKDRTRAPVLERATCGTAGCVAGHVVVGFRDELPASGDIQTAAAEWLGINEDDAYDLFYGHWPNRQSGQFLDDLTVEQAIEHLESLVDA